LIRVSATAQCNSFAKPETNVAVAVNFYCVSRIGFVREKKAEEDATFCLIKDCIFLPLFLSNERIRHSSEYCQQKSISFIYHVKVSLLYR
jgi:hypothetical protein